VQRYDRHVVHPASILLLVAERVVVVGGAFVMLLAWSRRR
jgi:hypothetical protein